MQSEILSYTKTNDILSRAGEVIKYGYLIRGYDAPAPNGQSCVLRVTAYVKTVYQYNVYRFLECQSVNWTAAGTSKFDVVPTSGNYNITSGGRYLQTRGAFDVTATVSQSLGFSYGVVGWSVSNGIYIRKWFTPSQTFDGDYPGAILY